MSMKHTTHPVNETIFQIIAQTIGQKISIDGEESFSASSYYAQRPY